MSTARIAYFSMEVALESAIPTYAGGLGVLAGDTLRAAADLGLPLVAVTLVHRLGYLKQQLDANGMQHGSPDPWTPEASLQDLPARITVTVEGQAVAVRTWQYRVHGGSGGEVPVYLLDTCLDENTPWQRSITDRLYGGDERYRLAQETVLGCGGVAMLRALGHEDIRVYHLNEGHSALLALALLEHEDGAGPEAIERVRDRCVFTTHTPVPAGHDQFPIGLAREVLGQARADRLTNIGCCLDGVLNLTHMALFFSRYVNGVAMRHGQISRGMYPGYPITSITNGVHAATWTAPAFREVYDRHIPDWRQQNDNLRYAVSIPGPELLAAHARCKAELIAEIEKRTGRRLSMEKIPLGFARRATPYKRAGLLLADPERLRRLGKSVQIVYAGKAHPRDSAGLAVIRGLFEAAERLRGDVEIVYLEGHDMDLARLLCAGVDLWVNTPKKPEEASGTSGMKAALNGVPSLSVLDGWWIEGHVEGVTGWSIGDSWEPGSDLGEAAQLYDKLEAIAARFAGAPESYVPIMRYAIALNGSFFNTQRMLEQYAQSAYRIGRRFA